MPKFSANGVSLYYEETGRGFPLVWSHEFAGNYESWEPQVRFFSRRYRVITYASRGYPPSDVPEGPSSIRQRSGDTHLESGA
ncbi:MAG: alpha/beta fold hydrolase [Dehalococcoidia bacterium]